MPVTDLLESTKKVEKKLGAQVRVFFQQRSAQRDAAQQRAKISSSRDAAQQQQRALYIIRAAEKQRRSAENPLGKARSALFLGIFCDFFCLCKCVQYSYLRGFYFLCSKKRKENT